MSRYCKECNCAVEEGVKKCPNCNADLSFNFKKVTTKTPTRLYWGMFVLGLFFWIVGFVMESLWIDIKPYKAKSIFIGAIFGLILMGVLLVLTLYLLSFIL